MPSLSDIPGKGLIEGTTKRARLLAAGAATGALAVGGVVVKRVLSHRGGGPDADPIAETPTAPPGAEEKPVPKPKPAEPKPKAAKPKPAKPPEPKPPKAKTEKPKAADPPKPKAEKPAKAKAASKSKPATTTGTDAPPKPDSEPGNISTDRGHPHRALNNPVVDPDETEYPDPFEKRPDPRDPVDPDGEPFGEEPHPQVGSESTSEPPPSQDPSVADGGKPPKRDKLDD